MMAVFTIYIPQTWPCPIEFSAGDLWKNPEKLSFVVKNDGPKPITKLSITSEIFLAPQESRRPSSSQWSSKTVIPPGNEQSLDKPGIPPASAQKIIGWIFLPTSVKYADGTQRCPERGRECFRIFWRELEHPEGSLIAGLTL
jgi:hypothetical protein